MIPRTEVLLVAADPVPGVDPEARRILHRADCLAHHGGGAVLAPGHGRIMLAGIHHLPFDLPPGATPAHREAAIGEALRIHLPRLKPRIVHCFGVHLAVPALLHSWKGNKVLLEPGLTPAQRLRDETPPLPRDRIADLVSLEDRCIARADAIIAHSATEAATLVRRGARSDKVWTIRDGVPEVPQTPLPDMPHLLFVGDLGPFSGWQVLVHALMRIKRPWRATFVLGRGKSAELERRITHARLGRRISFARLEDLEPRLAAARIVVCPAEIGRPLTSGAWVPQAVLWALGAGRALIAPDLQVIRSYAGPAARYFEPSHVGSLAEAIDGLLARPVEAERLAHRAQSQARLCNWRDAETAIRSLWTELVAR
jgi:glycosyltransferase involved in cell wall biosynthesis